MKETRFREQSVGTLATRFLHPRISLGYLRPLRPTREIDINIRLLKNAQSLNHLIYPEARM